MRKGDYLGMVKCDYLSKAWVQLEWSVVYPCSMA